MSAPTATAPASAGPAVLPPLQIGRHVVESPVVLAPMAGITNRAFRRLCREYGTAGLEAGGGVAGRPACTSREMVTSRALVERTPETMRLISHDPDENPRSVQLYSRRPGDRAGWPRGCSSPRTAPTTSTSTSAARCPRSPARAAGRRCRGRPTCSAPSSRAVGARGVAVRRAGHREDAHRASTPTT